MGSEIYSRYIFIGFEDLKQIKFDKLKQVCDKVYVFVNKEEKAIPFILVQQLQKLGESVQWIPVTGNTDLSFSYFISFYLGKIHELADEEVEFAIISENKVFDNIIYFLLEQGRSAVRVTRKNEKNENTSDLSDITWSTKEEVVEERLEMIDTEEKANGERAIDEPGENNVSAQNQKLSDRIAKETIKRLVMSGNRPAAIDALKSYILLQYNNAEVNRNIDLIIRQLEKTKEIQVKDREVVYNF